MMLLPQMALAALCLGLGLFPGLVLQLLDAVLTSLPGLEPETDCTLFCKRIARPVRESTYARAGIPITGG